MALFLWRKIWFTPKVSACGSARNLEMNSALLALALAWALPFTAAVLEDTGTQHGRERGGGENHMKLGTVVEGLMMVRIGVD